MRALMTSWLAALALIAVVASAAITTTVPVTEESASNIAVSMFPVSLKLDKTNLFLTEPQIVFVDRERIAITTRLQAYDHRPEDGVALSETGSGTLSGRVSYDRASREVILHDPVLEQLQFDRKNPTTDQFARELRDAWSEITEEPIRSELPPHPYIATFREHIDDILYDGKHISLVLVYR